MMSGTSASCSTCFVLGRARKRELCPNGKPDPISKVAASSQDPRQRPAAATMTPPQPQDRPDAAPSSDSEFVALTRSPGFWVIIGYAALFGVVLAFAALAFLGLLKGGTKLWFTLPKDPGWF